MKHDNNLLDTDYEILCWASGPDMLFLMSFIFYFAIPRYNEVKIKQSPPTKNTNITKNKKKHPKTPKNNHHIYMSQNKTPKLNPLKEKIEIQKNAKTIP